MNDDYRAIPPHTAVFANRVKLIGTEAAFGFGSRILAVEKTDGERVIRCNLGQPDFPLPEHIADAVIASIRAGQTTYCDPQGLPELREALARKIAADRGLPDIDPERVVVYPGARPSIGFAQQSYCERGDEIIYPTPGYPLYESYIPYVGAQPVPIRLSEDHGFSLTTEELAPLISDHTRLIYLNFPSNPTGGVASPDQLRSLSELILQKTPANVRVYSDEAYESIVFDGEKHVSIASVPGMEARTIIASAVSKTYSWTGGRVGWAVYPTVEEAKVHRNLNINYVASIPPYNQVGARVALESPQSEVAIKMMNDAFQVRSMCSPTSRAWWKASAWWKPTTRYPRTCGATPARLRCSSCSCCTATTWPPWTGAHSARWKAMGSTSCVCPWPPGPKTWPKRWRESPRRRRTPTVSANSSIQV
jgi:aspartate/methionine/tyrosine aminotransferase